MVVFRHITSSDTVAGVGELDAGRNNYYLHDIKSIVSTVVQQNKKAPACTDIKELKNDCASLEGWNKDRDATL